MKRGVSVWLLELVTWLITGFLLFFAVDAVRLLVIALFAPSEWPEAYTLKTAIAGFELPTVYLWARLIYIGREAAMVAVAALMILPIAGIVRSLKKGGPFIASNIIRLRLLALGCGIYGFGPLLSPLIPIDIRISLGLLDAFINGSAAAMALLALVLAEIFREGMRFRDDVEGTI
ncbi:MAG TPA: hypothetical protein VF649_11430 [Sphingomonas sp.]|jgi:hypothetical protein|uniref:hypothetical protein n=1 Tax=Sphingomonas sp. TaxID=28214 RepID=UPI002ED9CA5F